MAAIDFPPNTGSPSAPGDGQIFTAPNGNVYVFKASPAPGLWVAQVTVPGGSINQLRLYSEVIWSSGITEMVVTIPTGAKKIEVEWLANAASNKQLGMAYMLDGVPVGGANYAYQRHIALSAASFWEMGTGSTNFGKASFAPLPALVVGNATSLVIDAGSGAMSEMAFALNAGKAAGTVTGIRFTYVDTSAFTTGSFARLFAVW
jgi:hypothetical protein